MMFLHRSRTFLWALCTLWRDAIIRGAHDKEIFYRAGVFVEKERDLLGPLRAARARSNPDECGVHLEVPSGLIAPVGADGRFTSLNTSAAINVSATSPR